MFFSNILKFLGLLVFLFIVYNIIYYFCIFYFAIIVIILTLFDIRLILAVHIFLLILCYLWLKKLR